MEKLLSIIPSLYYSSLTEMDVFEAIQKRRSVRKFTGEAIPKKDLEKIVDAGRLAASGNNKQPWDFIVVTQPEMIKKFTLASQWMDKAGAVIAVVMDMSSRWWLEDSSAATENMMLASTALGYGSCWVEGTALPHEENFKELLGVPKEKRLMIVIPIGVPVEWPEKEKKSLEEVIHWEKF